MLQPLGHHAIVAVPIYESEPGVYALDYLATRVGANLADVLGWQWYEVQVTCNAVAYFWVTSVPGRWGLLFVTDLFGTPSGLPWRLVWDCVRAVDVQQLVGSVPARLTVGLTQADAGLNGTKGVRHE